MSPSARPPRFAAIDLDGTILTAEGRATEDMRRGLAALRGLGVRLIVATGRSPWSFASLRLDPALLELFEPVLVLHDGDVIFHRERGRALRVRALPRPSVTGLARTFPHVVYEEP